MLAAAFLATALFSAGRNGVSLTIYRRWRRLAIENATSPPKARGMPHRLMLESDAGAGIELAPTGVSTSETTVGTAVGSGSRVAVGVSESGEETSYVGRGPRVGNALL